MFPITLDRYFFTRFVVVSNPDHINGEEETVKVDLDSSIDVKEPEEGNGDTFIAEQRVKLDASTRPDLPYSLDIECIGFFKVDGSLERDKRLRAVTVVAHNVLYAAVRESVLSATARQAWGPFSLGLSVLRPTPVEDRASGELTKAAPKKSAPRVRAAAKTRK